MTKKCLWAGDPQVPAGPQNIQESNESSWMFKKSRAGQNILGLNKLNKQKYANVNKKIEL